MKHDTTMRDGIQAALKAMHQMLVTATQETYAACGYIDRNEQNLAIGTLIAVDDPLQQALTLYKAIIAMHRFRS